MDCIEDQPPNFKHYCRVCKKGFMCGRALGGHMRAHGIGDENGNLDEEDPTSDWEDKSDRTSNKRMYQLRTNPNRLRSCRICENCGKEFFSWKAFLEHGKCSSDSESLLSSPESEAEEDEGGGRRGGGGWTKRKRSLRAKVGNTIISSAYPSSEDEDLLLAKCLVQLANTRVELPTMVVEMESSSTSASREEERRNAMAKFFSPRTSTPLDKGKGVSSNNSKGIFECKACKKVFNSHQALGGHRASHKKVKGCYAAKQDQDHQLDDHSLADDDVITHEEFFPASKSPYNSPTMQFEQGPTGLVGAARRKSKVHECTICHRVFSSGQALGGHKRCHWITSNSPADTTKLQFHHHVEPINHYKPKIMNFDQALDLNLPAWADDISGLRRDPHNPLSFEVSTDIHLHPWINTGGDETDTKNIYNHPHQYYQKNEDDNNKSNGPRADGNNNNSNSVSHSVDDEADSSLRLAKLSDLKDMNPSGSSSQWLQVGISSTTACEQLSLSSGNKDIYLGTFNTQEEAADAYDIAAIKFRGLNAVTNFEISRYDVKSILESSTLPIGGAAKRLKDAENAELALDIQRRASNGNPISHLTDGLNGYNNGWHNAIAFHQPQPLSMYYPYPQQRYLWCKQEHDLEVNRNVHDLHEFRYNIIRVSAKFQE